MQQLKFIYKILKKRILKDFLSDTVHAESHFFQAYEQICLYIAFEMRCTLPCTSYNSGIKKGRALPEGVAFYATH